MTEKKIVSRECRHVTYVPPFDKQSKDLHVVKEVIHYDDNTSEPALRFIYDFERPFWVTKPGYRKGKYAHTQHKEWERKSRLLEFKTTEREAVRKISKALGEHWFEGDMYRRKESQYLYGIDIKSTAIIKHLYNQKVTKPTPYSIVELDYETSMEPGREDDVIMGSIYDGKRCYTVITEDAVRGIAQPLLQLERTTKKYLDKYTQGVQIIHENVLVKTSMDVIEYLFKKIHEWKPDILSIWNMTFEMEKTLINCEKYGVDPKDLFSDPEIPAEYKYFNYKEGKKIRETSSGKKSPVTSEKAWNSVFAPAHFVIIDQMCTYFQIRTGTQQLESYKLDAIQRLELGYGKLEVEENSGAIHASPDWHRWMARHKPIEYIVYNKFDVIGPYQIDLVTKDLSHTLSSMAGCSDFSDFHSQPRRKVDELHWEVQELEDPRVMGVTSNKLKDEFDHLTLSRDEWIITLQAGVNAEPGQSVIEETDSLETTVHYHAGDLDVGGSYPNGIASMGISKETCTKELVSIDGKSEELFRMQNMLISGGQTNALEYTINMFDFPKMEEMLDAFKAENNISNI